MICKKCGIELPDDAVKCPACDADISEEIVNENPEIIEEVSEIVEETETVEMVEDVQLSAKKSKKTLGVVVAAIVALVIAAAAFIGITTAMENQLANLSDPSPIAKLFGVKEEKAAVYILTKKENNFAYVKTAKGEQYLLRKLAQNESFEPGSEFVLKGNKLFFLNDEGGLSVMNIKNGKVTRIGEDFKPGTLSFSVKGNYVLFAGEDSMLYKSKNAKKAEEVEYLGNNIFENQLPAYGFVEGTNTVWYAVIDTQTQKASVYLESGDVILEDVSAVFRVMDKGNIAVYTKVTKEETITPEPVAVEEGEEPQEQEPVVVKTYALMVKEGSESVVLSEDYVTSDCLSFLSKDKQGILYTAERGETPVDEETGEILGEATAKLYFREFGGEPKLLAEGVSAALLIDELEGIDYYYDGSAKPNDETIIYMKENEVLFMKDFVELKNPKDFEFVSSAPVFGNDNNLMLYKTFVPVPIEEIEEGTEESEKPELPPAKLVFSTFENGSWGDYTVVAEDVVTYQYFEDRGEIYYTLNENEDLNVLSLYVYSIKDGKSNLVVDNVLPNFISFTDDGAYFVNNYNSETQFADISCFNKGKTETVVKDVAGFVSTESNTIFTTKVDGENTDLYMLFNDELVLVAKNFANIAYLR